MKVRVTILSENDRPVSVLGDNPESQVKIAWEFVLSSVLALGNSNDKFVIEKVEVEE